MPFDFSDYALCDEFNSSEQFVFDLDACMPPSPCGSVLFDPNFAFDVTEQHDVFYDAEEEKAEEFFDVCDAECGCFNAFPANNASNILDVNSNSDAVCGFNAFPANDTSEHTNNSLLSFVGLECHDYRQERFAFLQSNSISTQRFGLMLDTGAPDNAVGIDWLTRFIAAFGLAAYTKWFPHHASLGGIGSGRAPSEWQAQVPVGVRNNASDGSTSYKTQVLEGIGSHVPPLLGLRTMLERHSVLDLTNPNNLGITCDEPDGSRHRYKLHVCNGHLILPADVWSDQFDGIAMP